MSHGADTRGMAVETSPSGLTKTNVLTSTSCDDAILSIPKILAGDESNRRWAQMTPDEIMVSNESSSNFLTLCMANQTRTNV